MPGMRSPRLAAWPEAVEDRELVEVQEASGRPLQRAEVEAGELRRGEDSEALDVVEDESVAFGEPLGDRPPDVVAGPPGGGPKD